jgi:AcrR family transcriptional regulator
MIDFQVNLRASFCGRLARLILGGHMASATKKLAPKQARSRESAQRLLAAARDVVAEMGLEGATIPRIAARAGLSPGAIYRRFPDKDSLLQAVVLKTLQESDDGTKLLLESEEVGNLTLESRAAWFVKGMVNTHRNSPGLMRTVLHYVLIHPDPKFRKKADSLQDRTFRRIVDFFLQKRGEIVHPDPDIAVPLSLMMTGSTINAIIDLNTFFSKNWAPLAKDDERLQHELTTALLAYLGIDRNDHSA